MVASRGKWWEGKGIGPGLNPLGKWAENKLQRGLPLPMLTSLSKSSPGGEPVFLEFGHLTPTRPRILHGIPIFWYFFFLEIAQMGFPILVIFIPKPNSRQFFGFPPHCSPKKDPAFLRKESFPSGAPSRPKPKTD